MYVYVRRVAIRARGVTGSDRSRTGLFVTAGDSRDLDTVHHYVDGGADAEHDTGDAGERRGEGRVPGQPSVRHGGAGVHHVVHARVPAAVQRVPEQVEVLQGRPERDRPAGHTAVLRVPDPGGRDGQDGHAPVRRRAPRHTDIPDHAHTAHPQAGPALHRAPEPRVHVAQLVQGAGPAHAVPGHGRADILQPRVLRRERGARHQVPVHTGDVLVGRHHHDHGGLRRHIPDHRARQGHRRRLLYLRRAGHCAAHSDYRQQFCRVL